MTTNPIPEDKLQAEVVDAKNETVIVFYGMKTNSYYTWICIKRKTFPMAFVEYVTFVANRDTQDMVYLAHTLEPGVISAGMNYFWKRNEKIGTIFAELRTFTFGKGRW